MPPRTSRSTRAPFTAVATSFLLTVASVAGCRKAERPAPAPAVLPVLTTPVAAEDAAPKWAREEAPKVAGLEECAVASEGERVALVSSKGLAVALPGTTEWAQLAPGAGDELFTNDGGATFVTRDTLSDPDYVHSPPDREYVVERVAMTASATVVMLLAGHASKKIVSAPAEPGAAPWRSRVFLARYGALGRGYSGPEGGAMAVVGDTILLPGRAGKAPAIYASEDAGATWRLAWKGEREAPAVVDLQFLPGGRTGWVLREDGTVWGTFDGCRSFVRLGGLPDSERGHARSLAMVDPATGFIVGAGGLALKTSDGGRTWHRMTTPARHTLNVVRATPEGRAWAAGEAGTVLESADEGRTWRRVELGLAASFRSLAVVRGRAVLVVGGFLFRSA